MLRDSHTLAEDAVGVMKSSEIRTLEKEAAGAVESCDISALGEEVTFIISEQVAETSEINKPSNFCCL